VVGEVVEAVLLKSFRLVVVEGEHSGDQVYQVVWKIYQESVVLRLEGKC
jgi:hypothetical protein